MGAKVMEAFEYDPFAKEVMKDPHPFYKTLREDYPVYYIDKYDAFVFSRFDDIVDLMSHHDNTFVSTGGTLPSPDHLLSTRHKHAPPLAPTTAPLGQAGALGSPYYEELRLAQIKPLRPKSVQALRDFIRSVASERLDILLPRKQFDLAQEYSGIVSASVICHLFDMPLERAPAVLAMVNGVTVSDQEKGGVDYATIVKTLVGEILPYVAKRRKAGADGSVPIIDGLIHYRIDGRALDDHEISEQLMVVFGGGTETAPKIAAHGLMELSLRPEQLAEVRSDLDTNVPIAVEEIIRYCAPAQWFARTAHKDVVIGGQLVRAGQRVIALLGSAARDEREFENADEFIWNRKIERVLSFGFGQHHCIGVHLARAELRILLQEFLSRVSSFYFEMDKAVRMPSSFQWGWSRLPVIIE